VTPADPAAVRAALQKVAVWPPDLAPDDRYRSLAALVDDGLAKRICRQLGDPPLRVGHSAVVMGLASRLWSLLVVPAARDRLLVDTTTLVARDESGGVVLGLREVTGWRDPSPDEVAAAVARVLDPVVSTVPLSPRLSWGNVAASLHAVPRVHDEPSAISLVGALLARPPYAGELVELADGRARRRTTCCLFYLVPGAGLCGDCVFDEPPDRSRDES
jgi:hypothetical protein